MCELSWIGAGMHATHHVGIDLAATHRTTSKLMRHTTTWSALLAAAWGHSGPHGVSSYTGMIHACWMT